MTSETRREPVPAPEYQNGRLLLRFGRRAGLSASVNVTSTGLLSIAALVSSILLSTAVLVRVAVREGKKPQPDLTE